MLNLKKKTNHKDFRYVNLGELKQGISCFTSMQSAHSNCSLPMYYWYVMVSMW